MPEGSPSILFVNRVFPPDRGATGRCLADLTERLARRGWRVSVVADGAGGEEEARRSCVALWRTGRAIPAGDRPDARGYLDSLLRLTWRALRLPRHDVVVTMTDPPLLGRVGPLLAARHGAAAIHWSQDVFPALLPVLGAPLPPSLFQALERSMARALGRHDAVLAIGRCMARRLVQSGVAESRVILCPNWPDSRIRPIPHAVNGWRAEQGLEGRFVVAYSGTLGLAHPMDGVLDAAAGLLASDPAILFLVIGEGRGRGAVAEAIQRRGLTNVRLAPWQPAERLAESLSAADLHLTVMNKAAVGLMAPSKLLGGLAAGRPGLFLGPADSEAAHHIRDWGCGAVLEPQNGQGLAERIRGYAADPARCAREGAVALRSVAGWGADDAASRIDAVARDLVARRSFANGARTRWPTLGAARRALRRRVVSDA
ncbi:glycosyltransferase family 4 protein [Azospirillum cavernae]|uniref:glycosyltransferase family 4 protein n=1 Tax=Azospirillum cavernae TaxID=2320860 RepID=UPI001EE52CDC|nr:glycosyltransferase family 4 protein [Azospirillum cavernae]